MPDRAQLKPKGARKQVAAEDVQTESDERQGGVFNIWYQQWSGGDGGKSYFYTKPALGRCDPKRDSGYTKGDDIKGAYFCLNFARGICPKGKKCDKLHRIPSVEDLYPPSVDCFGRKKHANYKEDMSGVGSFLRQNRTLYVAQTSHGKNLEEAVSRHFSAFGDIERVRVIGNRQLAFVTYMNENSAQFAKEAMNRQSLDGNEILTVKWASEDPSPQAQQREKRRLEEQAAEAIRKLLPESQVKEVEGDPTETKKRRIEGSYGLEGYQAPDEVWYGKPTVEEPEEPVPETAQMKQIEAPANSSDKESEEDGGLFSSNTLQNVKNLAAKPAPKAKASKALVSYDSDDDE